MSDAETALATMMATLGLTVDSVFVPLSKSRNAGEKHRTLNWRVTVKRNGREILTTDYSAGIAHCPAYSEKSLSLHNTMAFDTAIKYEVEHGRAFHGRKPIIPEPTAVISSIVMDCDVIDYPSFEEWASDFGFDADSRKAESIYRTCLEGALKMRAAIGYQALTELRELAR